MVTAKDCSSVCDQAREVASRISSLTSRFERDHPYLAGHLGRTSRSIASVLAEADRRESESGRTHFYSVACGSIAECASLLESASQSSLISREEHRRCQRELDLITRRIAGRRSTRVEWVT